MSCVNGAYEGGILWLQACWQLRFSVPAGCEAGGQLCNAGRVLTDAGDLVDEDLVLLKGAVIKGIDLWACVNQVCSDGL